MGSKSRKRGRHSTWTLSIWIEDRDHQPYTSAGELRTRVGQAWSFRSLAELDRLLCELGGWIDPSDGDAGSLPPENHGLSKVA